MVQCRVCSRDFDPQGFQVVVPALGQGFDRIECAEAARSRGVPAAPPPEAPQASVVRPFPAPSVAASAAALPALGSARGPVLAGANLALLAAGTAVTVYLWLRVFGVDPSSSPALPPQSTPQAFERATVPAVIDTTPERAARPEPTSRPVRRTPPPPAPAPAESPAAATTLVAQPLQPSPAAGDGAGGGSDGGGSKGGGDVRGGDGGAGARARPAPSAGPPASAPASRPAKTGAPPYGKANGHDKAKNANHMAAHAKGNGNKTGHDKHH